MGEAGAPTKDTGRQETSLKVELQSRYNNTNFFYTIVIYPENLSIYYPNEPIVFECHILAKNSNNLSFENIGS